ncbi:MAG: UDP-N-acetylglucosamine 1-carboxyvinyltransferase [Patescibacteria group bacterium]
MESFVARGAKPLGGEVAISGSKNAAFPLIAACILTEETCVLESVPDIQDVAIMLDIAKKLGVGISWDRSGHRLEICAKEISSSSPDDAGSRKFRGSVLFAGVLLGRLRRAEIPYPGGDAIGARPLTAHFRAFEELGAVIRQGNTIEMDGSGLRGNEFFMDEPSVSATENAILASVLAPGKTVISLGATEPHVQELVLFLRDMGADIRFRDLTRVEIHGVARLKGARRRINPDELEVSAFAALGACTRSELTLSGIAPQYLDAVFLQLKKMGVAFERRGDTMKIMKPTAGYKSFRIQSGLYPKLGSDHLPPFAVLATQAEGASLIHDWMYENRLRYLSELQKMGADCEVLDPHRARISGPTHLAGCRMESFDIRSGMTLVIAALVGAGESIIERIEHIDRGYERLDERLRSLGADIERIES